MVKTEDFQSIVLNRASLNLLRRMARKNVKRVPATDELLLLEGFRLAFPVVVGRDQYGSPKHGDEEKITDRGRLYLVYLRRERARMVFTPIVIALLTTLATNYLLPLLWQGLQGLLKAIQSGSP